MQYNARLNGLKHLSQRDKDRKMFLTAFPKEQGNDNFSVFNEIVRQAGVKCATRRSFEFHFYRYIYTFTITILWKLLQRN